jgi:hypothetical protein
MNIDELFQEAKAGNMVAQYELAEYYGKLLRETDNEDEIYNYSKQAMIWLKKSAKQGYKPAVDAVSELNKSAAASQGSGRPPSQSEAEKPAPFTESAPSAKEERPAAKPLSPGAAAVVNSVSDSTETSQPQSSAAKGERYFASTTHIVVVCMLVISLLINIFLLYFLFRIVKAGDFIEGGASASPTPSFVLSPSPEPEVSPTTTPASTPEPHPFSDSGTQGKLA